MPPSSRPRQSLRQGLDRDVYQIVKRLEEDRPPPKNGRKRNRLAVSDVYEVIKKSNSSLSRQKRKPLEDAIERVLEFHKQEDDDSDSEAAIEVEENKSNKVSYQMAWGLLPATFTGDFPPTTFYMRRANSS